MPECSAQQLRSSRVKQADNNFNIDETSQADSKFNIDKISQTLKAQLLG